MFVPSDNISEVIAHFIGCFEIRVDEIRMRHAYEEFFREQAVPRSGPIEHITPGFFNCSIWSSTARACAIAPMPSQSTAKPASPEAKYV
ncbi:hypothetical protein [Devosia aurantiaca]|uniref:Uncharacterized protein n=1 Tax=Devosia aurantiaca TaxID=2714858 RepID=A0A6M1SMG7_9HYPH|nr:hypothetical protein [Devosia aurantiaca]NGP18398.1 hypothetical protein [Devosia aurantiaca]